VEEARDDKNIKQENLVEEMKNDNPEQNLLPMQQPQGMYVTRSGRISRPPN
jgi:hypothetical protein